MSNGLGFSPFRHWGGLLLGILATGTLCGCSVSKQRTLVLPVSYERTRQVLYDSFADDCRKLAVERGCIRRPYEYYDEQIEITESKKRAHCEARYRLTLPSFQKLATLFWYTLYNRDCSVEVRIVVRPVDEQHVEIRVYDKRCAYRSDAHDEPPIIKPLCEHLAIQEWEIQKYAVQN